MLTVLLACAIRGLQDIQSTYLASQFIEKSKGQASASCAIRIVLAIACAVF
jgi:hypothetical protein